MSLSQSAQPTQPAGHAPTSAESIDFSGRVPLLVLFGAAATWLVVASVLALIGSIKFHSPNFLSESAWLTYGRVRPAFITALVYGFLIQSALGLTLWIFARLGSCRLALNPLTILGAVVLNIGAFAGLLGILAGDASGYEWYDMPAYGNALFLLGYLTIGISAAVTFHQRTTNTLYVSQWFLVAALLWLPWIASTGLILLNWNPVRGVTQAVIAWWYAGNLRVTWLWLFGLGCLFYFLPKLSGRDLHSRYLALVTFWVLIFCGSWTGIPSSAPVPAWMPVASRMGSILCFIVLASVYLNISRTLKGPRSESKPAQPELRFFWLAYLIFLAVSLLEVLTAFAPVENLVAFTWFVPAEGLGSLLGVGAMVTFGGVYHILPRAFGTPWPKPGLIRLHYFVMIGALAFWVVPQAVGGIAQGFKLQNAAIPFMDVSLFTLKFLRASTLGELLFLAGALMFLANIVALGAGFYRQRARSFSQEALRDLRLAREVGA